MNSATHCHCHGHAIYVLEMRTKFFYFLDNQIDKQSPINFVLISLGDVVAPMDVEQHACTSSSYFTPDNPSCSVK